MRILRRDIFRRLFRKGIVDRKYEKTLDRNLLDEIEEEMVIEKKIEDALTDRLEDTIIDDRKKMILIKKEVLLKKY